MINTLICRILAQHIIKIPQLLEGQKTYFNKRIPQIKSKKSKISLT